MKEIELKKSRKLKRQKRIRKKILAQKTKMRLSVFRSNKYFYAQIIDDINAKTKLTVSEKELDVKKGTKIEKAAELGKIMAAKAIRNKIKEVVFDKGSYRYHGRVRAFAESARKEGLSF